MISYGIIQLPWWAALLAGIVAIIGAGRLTRLLTTDSWPPVVWLRIRWETLTHDGPWSHLVRCLWCVGPWAFLLALGTFTLSFYAVWAGWVWWLFWGWLAGAYLTSQYVYFDEGKGE